MIFHHTWIETSLGHAAVRLFFVLSGYLITGILLRARDDAAFATGPALAGFYLRRARRIVPPYYLIIVATLLVQFHAVLPSLWWHLTFTSNIYFSFTDAWDPWTLAHLWTISIEEQFYLVWPLLMFAVPPRFRLHLGLAAIAFAVAFRFVGPLFGLPWLALDLLPFASLDALGIGAVLARPLG